MHHRAIAALPLLVVGCGILGLDDRQARERLGLERASKLWAESAPPSYRFVLKRSCYCGMDVTAAVRVVVDDGAVVSRTYVESGEPVPPQWHPLFPTMEGVFAVLREAMEQDAASIVAAYDARLGFPIDVAIDYLAEAIDDELSLSVRAFVPE
jgi:hypothetical protein